MSEQGPRMKWTIIYDTPSMPFLKYKITGINRNTNNPISKQQLESYTPVPVPGTELVNTVANERHQDVTFYYETRRPHDMNNREVLRILRQEVIPNFESMSLTDAVPRVAEIIDDMEVDNLANDFSGLYSGRRGGRKTRGRRRRKRATRRRRKSRRRR